MPTYDYECGGCGHRFERFQQMSDARVRSCPECGGKVNRLIGAGAAIISKGSGVRSGERCPAGLDCGRDMPCCGQDGRCQIAPFEE